MYLRREHDRDEFAIFDPVYALTGVRCGEARMIRTYVLLVPTHPVRLVAGGWGH